MRLLIFGSRIWDDPELIKGILELVQTPDLVVIEGEAPGADTHARKACEELDIQVEAFRAEWKKYGRAAGPIRNKQMIDEGKPTQAIGFHHNIAESRGSKNMYNQLVAANIPVMIID